MDTKQFIASLVSSAAWPLAVFGVALLFRKQIAAILAVPVKRLKAGPVELEFERVLPGVQAKLAEAAGPSSKPEDEQGGEPGTAPPAPTPPSPAAPAAPAQQPSAAPAERAPDLRFGFDRRSQPPPAASFPGPSPLARLATARRIAAVSVREELARVAAIAPNATVIAAHTRLHGVLSDLVGMYDPLWVLESSPPLPSLAYRLVKRGLISQTVGDAVLELSILRNLIGHDEQPDISAATAREYLDSVDSVLAAISAALAPAEGGNKVATDDTESDSPGSEPERSEPEKD